MNSLLNLFVNSKVQFLFIFLCIIIISSFFFNSIEGFETSKNIPSQYEYLSPIPENAVWADEVQQKFIEKYNSIHNLTGDSLLTKEKLTAPNPFLGNRGFMGTVSEKEALYYIENGIFPYDEYVTNYLSTQANPPIDQNNLNNYQKGFPNRAVYKLLIKNQTVPQLKTISDILWPTRHDLDNGKGWLCQQGSFYYTDNVTSQQPAISTDYGLFETIIPDFKFENGPCNVCELQNIKSQAGQQITDVYDSPENKCKFKVGEVPEAYNIYMGNYGTVNSNVFPSSTLLANSINS